jgi:hypothetical protein
MPLQAAQEVGLAAPRPPMKQDRFAMLHAPDAFKSSAAHVKGLPVDLGDVHQGFPGVLHNGLAEGIRYPGQEVQGHVPSLSTMPT